MANMVALGALNAAPDFIVDTASLIQAFEKTFRHKPEMIEPNKNAIVEGIKCIVS
jgi:Pyruvate/2-oxoacid:ferredoxin oxidoreductase gamma subunit